MINRTLTRPGCGLPSSHMHLLDDRVEQHKDRQEDEEPHCNRFGLRKFTVWIGVGRVGS